MFDFKKMSMTMLMTMLAVFLIFGSIGVSVHLWQFTAIFTMAGMALVAFVGWIMWMMYGSHLSEKHKKQINDQRRERAIERHNNPTPEEKVEDDLEKMRVKANSTVTEYRKVLEDYSLAQENLAVAKRKKSPKLKKYQIDAKNDKEYLTPIVIQIDENIEYLNKMRNQGHKDLSEITDKKNKALDEYVTSLMDHETSGDTFKDVRIRIDGHLNKNYDDPIRYRFDSEEFSY